MISRKTKKQLLDALHDTPWISVACKRVGISRATLYRWLNEDDEMSGQIRDSIEAGRYNLIDYAESNLMKKVGEGNLEAIKFVLSHLHRKYQPIKATPPVFDPEDLTDPVAVNFNRAWNDGLKSQLDQIDDDGF